ncbi:4Fe-4S binding protein [Candidatus Marinimicrobia bacterium]|nr:4Fe-4S binding protein [Candidatus Neomarinimicrobiota bacterium]
MINIIDNKCDFCGTCITVCPVDCIEVTESNISIDDTTCIDCNLCVYICPIEVLKTSNEK